MNVSLASLVVPLVLATATAAVAATVTEEIVVVTAVGRVNINTAGVKELMTLEGVGRKVAEKVIEHRTAKGPFRKPADFRKVPGVGAEVWEKNRERIVVK
ncbi:MAG: helix-hairpin-helix domain-containing protein [Candidatus Rokubacteria bacterium]|nr:helix-hairpin-helix domain-containing protein [Candidatus Rokubacteria bacterium]